MVMPFYKVKMRHLMALPVNLTVERELILLYVFLKMNEGGMRWGAIVVVID